MNEKNIKRIVIAQAIAHHIRKLIIVVSCALIMCYGAIMFKSGMESFDMSIATPNEVALYNLINGFGLAIVGYVIMSRANKH